MKNNFIEHHQKNTNQSMPLQAVHIRTHLLHVAAGILLLFLSAQTSIPMGCVPITLQTVGLIVLCFCFPKGISVLATSLYVTLGVLGVPVFGGYRCGALHLLGPTGGYLMGMIVAAWAIDAFRTNIGIRNWYTALLCGCMGIGIIYGLGVGMLAYSVGWKQALSIGFFPFVPIELFKQAVSWFIISQINKRTGNPLMSIK